MKRILIWASPILGVIVGMAGILVFRQQSPVESPTPHADSLNGKKVDLHTFHWTTLESGLPEKNSEALVDDAVLTGFEPIIATDNKQDTDLTIE